MSPNKAEYDGPKNYDEICIEINRRLGYDKRIVGKIVSYFLYRTVFLKLKVGKEFSLRGIGNFVPWQSTKNKAMNGQRQKKLNVDSRTASHNVSKMRMWKKDYRKRQEKKKDNLQNGWDF